MTTIKDIARELGVDYSTVSLALRDHPGVAAATRERIRETATRLGYVPNRAAQALRRGSSRMISFVLWGNDSDKIRQSFPDYTLAATSAAFAAGYELLLLQATAERLANTTIDRFPELRQTDGALFVGETMDRAGLATLVRAGFPVVHLGDRALEDVTLPCVSADYVQGAWLAAEHLLGYGHRRLAVLYGPHPYAPEICRLRVDGFVAGAGEAVLERIEVDEGTRMPPVLDRLRQQHISAVFATEARIALRLLSCCQMSGVRIPATLSVVAFDDLPAAALSVPPLTCVRQPRELAGQMGVELLRELIEGRTPEQLRVLLPCTLVERSSVTEPEARR